MEEQAPQTTREMLRTALTKIDVIEGALLGNPEFKRMGLVHDVQKLQRENSNSKKFQWTASAGFSSILLKFVYNIFQ